MKIVKRLISIFTAVLIVISVFAFSGCKKNDANADKEDGNGNQTANEENSDFIHGESNPTAVIDVENYGKITVQLRYDKAPDTVKNFIYLANKGFYDGVIFHRIIDGLIIQGGDPEGTGFGGPGYSIKGEFANNGFEQNDLKHVRGTISMARTNANMNSAGSQFFICQTDYPSWDGDYAAFGTVIDGMDIVDKIASVNTDSNDKPIKDVIIKSVTVDTQGVSYGEPETIVK